MKKNHNKCVSCYNNIVKLMVEYCPGAANSSRINTENGVPIIPANNAKIK